jgi:hypothetical protein
MRKNNTTLIVIIAGIFLFFILAIGSLGYGVYLNVFKTGLIFEEVDTESPARQKGTKKADDVAKTDTKSEEKEKKKVTLSDIKKRTAVDTEYSDNLAFRMKPIHSLYNSSDLDYEDTEQITIWGNEWDNELNAVYQALMKKLTPSQQEELKAEQRKWIKNRDAELDKTNDHFVNAALFYDLTMERTYQLAELYDKVK